MRAEREREREHQIPYFSLTVFASADYRLVEMPDPYRSTAGPETRHEGEWTDRTAGGSTNNPQMHDLNPKWAIKLGTGTEPQGTRLQLRIQLFGSREKAVGIVLRAAGHESIVTEVILTSGLDGLIFGHFSRTPPPPLSLSRCVSGSSWCILIRSVAC